MLILIFNIGFSNASRTWLPVHDNYKEINLKNQKSQPESRYKLYQTLTKLRNTSLALRNGTLNIEILNNNTVLAVVRRNHNEGVILLINFSNEAQQNVNVMNLLPGAVNATVVVSSVNSGIKWG